ncbi:MAG: ABC transporter ATP-binding protein [Planctomycetes bacterium]|nr:ABC transporter ATP-binding protein [Planctomycetota bacterium]
MRAIHLSKVYELGAQQVRALDDVSLEIGKGEYVAIMGPSGSGKSTLMNVLGCLDVPSSGEYWLRGQEVSKLSEDELAEIRNREIGFVFQTFHLLARQTALRNVELPLVYGAVRADERRARALELLRQVGLEKRADHKPNELSGGERQRVAIARALVNRPALLLADEPTGNLDSRTGKEILELLDRLHGEGHTILLVTHDPEVGRRAARTVRVRDGRIESDAPNR